MVSEFSKLNRYQRIATNEAYKQFFILPNNALKQALTVSYPVPINTTHSHPATSPSPHRNKEKTDSAHSKVFGSIVVYGQMHYVNIELNIIVVLKHSPKAN